MTKIIIALGLLTVAILTGVLFASRQPEVPADAMFRLGFPSDHPAWATCTEIGPAEVVLTWTAFSHNRALFVATQGGCKERDRLISDQLYLWADGPSRDGALSIKGDCSMAGARLDRIRRLLHGAQAKRSNGTLGWFLSEIADLRPTRCVALDDPRHPQCDCQIPIWAKRASPAR